MANEEQLNILRQGVEVWNEWRKTGRYDELRNADLENANLEGVMLAGANLQDANLQGADLQGALLWRANLKWANLERANLEGAVLQGANLHNVNLQKALLERTNLVCAILSNSNITGCRLYGTARDDWTIDNIECDYVFWDEEGEKRIPLDRNFNPGEFEERYKQLPTFEYHFGQDFTPIDAVLINQTVQTINQKHPEFELRLDSLHSRGQPHAVFTVLQKEYVETALEQITTFYEEKLIKLEGRREQLWEDYMFLANHPQINIQELVMGNQTKKIAARDFYENGVSPQESAKNCRC